MLGFLPILARFWFVIPLLALTASTAYYRHDAASVRAEFADFKVQNQLVAIKAEAAKAEKEKKDAERINHAVASRDSAISRLRKSQANPRSGFVPNSTGTADADSRVCYDRQALDSALRKLDSGVSQIVGSCDQTVIDALSLLSAWPK